MEQWTEAAARAAASHPVCLSGFELSVLPPTEAAAYFVEYQLSCKSCGGEVFRISAHPKIAPDPSPYYLIPPGATFQRPPHSLECTRCSARSIVFDARKHGYDGVLNGGCTYESGDDGEAFVPGEFKVVVTLTYNAELPELQELAAEAKVQSADLFDWFAIKGVRLDGGEPFKIDYECA
jgi:hypothetical protein